MLKFLADENFGNPILQGVKQRLPDFDYIRLQDTEIKGASDPDVLEWAAEQNRLLLTHDAKTIPGYTYERVERGETMPGVVLIRRKIAIGVAIEEMVIFIECSREGEWEGRVVELPLKQ